MSQAARHLSRKPPRKTRGFSWARIPHDDLGVVDYRLTRGDAIGALHHAMRTFRVDTSRSEIARLVWAMRIRLRDAVDDLTLQQLGVTP